MKKKENNEKNEKREKEEEVLEGTLEGGQQSSGGRSKKKKKESPFKFTSCFSGFHCPYAGKISAKKGSLLGLFILFLGLFYLGKSLTWWSYNLNWGLIGAVIIIYIALAIMGAKEILKWILKVFLIILIIALLFLALWGYQDNRFEKRAGGLRAKPGSNYQHYQKGIDLRPNYSFRSYEFKDGAEKRSLQANLSRPELEQELEQILDYLYQKVADRDEKIDLELEIKRKIPYWAD